MSIPGWQEWETLWHIDFLTILCFQKDVNEKIDINIQKRDQHLKEYEEKVDKSVLYKHKMAEHKTSMFDSKWR